MPCASRPSGADRDERRIREEDRRFCDFMVAQLREGSSVPLHELVLRAYAQIPGIGDYPGSPPHLAVARDPCIRILRSISALGEADMAASPAVARADTVADRVRPGARRRPPAAKAGTSAHLAGPHPAARARARKIRHLEVPAQYLASRRDLPPTALVGATGVYLTAFFFWTYVRGYPCSPSDTETFTLDVRDL
ncbi:hypothetical protein [Geochorda subterranea]|uniref:Uncharacterized protein n=1 Tax=Geochorda subterranea TaxID=3109564 RepID=A0ABZ1BSJ3_9FIRM|nr:hypothetical protein [Limnochorda sp. LNt]WRP15761.1 hypothetical protein VLY81_06300 [Limnochorda sp. LNt]